MTDSPADAGRPATHGPTRVYANDEIRVLWDAGRCIHTAICLRRLPQVFDTDARPWVNLDAADAASIAEAVAACPTGALRYESDVLPAEQPATPTAVRVLRKGPLFVRGDVEVDVPGAAPARELRVALCRCGASRNKPYCDNSHWTVDFDDGAADVAT